MLKVSCVLPVCSSECQWSGGIVDFDVECSIEHRIDRGVAPDQERVKVPLAVGRNLVTCKVVNTGAQGGFYHREIVRQDDLPRATVALLASSSSTCRWAWWV